MSDLPVMVELPKQAIIEQIAASYLDGHNQGVIKGLELAERMTKIDLSDARRVFAEEAAREKKEYDEKRSPQVL